MIHLSLTVSATLRSYPVRMTMRRGEYYSSDEVLYYKLMNGKWGLLVLSLFNFIIGLVTFGLCMWIRFDLDFREWVRELEW